jgi:hypothetical protein
VCGACAFRYTEAAAASTRLASVPTRLRVKQHGLTREVGRPETKHWTVCSVMQSGIEIDRLL